MNEILRKTPAASLDFTRDASRPRILSKSGKDNYTYDPRDGAVYERRLFTTKHWDVEREEKKEVLNEDAYQFSGP